MAHQALTVIIFLFLSYLVDTSLSLSLPNAVTPEYYFKKGLAIGLGSGNSFLLLSMLHSHLVFYIAGFVLGLIVASIIWFILYYRLKKKTASR